MTEVQKDSNVFFGRPYVGDEIDVWAVSKLHNKGTDSEEIVELYKNLGYDVSNSDIETALEYFEENPEEFEALKRDDQRFTEEYDPDRFHSEQRFEQVYGDFIQRYETEYDFLLNGSS